MRVYLTILHSILIFMFFVGGLNAEQRAIVRIISLIIGVMCIIGICFIWLI